MNQYQDIEFKSFLWKGNLRGAVEYLRMYPEKAQLVDKYVSIFEGKEVVIRSNNPVINDIDKLYQTYYRNVFWEEMPNSEASERLFTQLAAYSESNIVTSEIENEVIKLVENQGYQCLCGDTQGYYGPYIWKNTTPETYDVELPNGIEPYTVNMMDGFISRSWLDYISFGATGAGGWVGEHGVLCCVREVYDINSDGFQISFLKHEAQHAYDKKNYPGLNATQLEYRAKLIELYYYPDQTIIRSILKEADDSNNENSHAFASHQIVRQLKNLLGNDVNLWTIEDIKKQSLELYLQNCIAHTV